MGPSRLVDMQGTYQLYYYSADRSQPRDRSDQSEGLLERTKAEKTSTGAGQLDGIVGGFSIQNVQRYSQSKEPKGIEGCIELYPTADCGARYKCCAWLICRFLAASWSRCYHGVFHGPVICLLCAGVFLYFLDSTSQLLWKASYF